LVLIAVGCGRETSRPFNHAHGTLTVEGADYHSALIIQHEPDGIHAVGGFVSDAPLGKITIGPDNSQEAPLQIIPSQGIVVHNGKKHAINNDGRLIWIIEGKTIVQKLVGFPLEKDLKNPKDS
jgi:hypothetical protein